MSPAVVATSSSSPHQIARFPGPELTYLHHSSSSSCNIAANDRVTAGALDPLPKRRRVEPPASQPSSPRWAHDDVFVSCLKKQVFPHVDRAVAQLPSDQLDTHAIGRRVVEIVTSPATNFTEAYKQGNGTLSPQFERRLAFRASTEIQLLSQRSEFRLPQLRPSETPVPTPRIPTSQNGSYPPPKPKVIANPTPETPRYSTSPIPLPVVPHRSVSSGTPPRQPVTPGLASSPIVIDDSSGNHDGQVQSQPIAPIQKTQEQQTRDLERSSQTPGAEETVKADPSLRSLIASPSSSAVSRSEVRQAAQPSLSQVWQFEGQTSSTWFSTRHQPYISAEERALVLRGSQRPIEIDRLDIPAVFHVDFTMDELRKVQTVVRQFLKISTKKKRDVKKDLNSLLRKNRGSHAVLATVVEAQNILPRRKRDDYANLFRDLTHQKTSRQTLLLSLSKGNDDAPAFARASRVTSLLFRREISGQRGLRSMRCRVNFTNEFKVCREDELALRAEWTDCAGDIATIVWVSNDAFICGTTEHSDSHNQQYNKAGNLVLGSCSLGTLRAYPEHRIVRPIVEKGENSTEAMRQTQDPWLYSSVVSSDYDAAHDRAFTSGFDRTVKIWEVKSGASMRLLGEWTHGGNVNFVAASKHECGMVATASDVAADAVRIYTISESNISASPYRSYSCSRVTDAEGNTVSTEKWAYFPATMQWGVSEGVRHLLLVGYSPRSRTGDDSDIPEDRLCSGELCLWDGLTGERWRLTSATTQNVFEVLWHPTQDSFIAATSPLGLDVEDRVRTQIRVFRVSESQEYGGKAFTPVKTLDCFAADINELTIMPNSFTFCYVTAGCTDGNTYVWDTAQGDKPLHILRHGECIEELRGDREREDVGVKFTAWGATLDRFYTGSSDGVVKVWNVRCLDRPLVRTLLEVPAQVSCGMFSPDRTKLIIGDASGRVFLLSIDEEGTKPAEYTTITLPGGLGVKKLRRPIPIIQHAEPPPPAFDAGGQPYMVETGPSRGHTYLQTGQLRRHPDPTIGVVQGPNYAETGLYLAEAHFNNDPSAPLLASWEAKQQEPTKGFPGRRREQFTLLRPVKEHETLLAKHANNSARDLNIESLATETKLELAAARADLNPTEDYDFTYDEAWSDDGL